MADTIETEWLSIPDMVHLIRTEAISAEALTRRFLSRIERFDGTLGACCAVYADEAIDTAIRIDRSIAEKKPAGPLAGIPFLAKDLFDIAGRPTAVGSALLADNVAAADSAVVADLRAAGLVLLGKTNLTEFSFGVTGVNTIRPTPHNPWSARPRVPGGSSSGSAVAVAAGLAPLALGTDTGGSTRIPASLCGVVGFKPGRDRLDRAGVAPFSHNFDAVGVLVKTVEDAALVYALLARDSAVSFGPGAFIRRISTGIEGLRIGVLDQYGLEYTQNEVAAAVREAAETLRHSGAVVQSADPPVLAEVVRLKSVVPRVEGFAFNRSRIEQFPDRIDPLVVRRLSAAGKTPSADYIEALRRTVELRKEASTFFQDVDVWVLPSVARAADPFEGVGLADLEKMLESYGHHATIANQLDLPAISVPCGFTRDGMPIGLQICAANGNDDLVLRVALAYERSRALAPSRPNLDWLG
jgi:aspartyl-tRNA(Asn)/glutamyl-tRNA(Gln) amidotransferase subunit A